MKEDPTRCLANLVLVRDSSTRPKRRKTIKRPIDVSDGSPELFKIRRTKENFQQLDSKLSG